MLCGFKIDNVYEDISRTINFLPVGCLCNQPHCYNGHSFLVLGDIPKFSTSTYCEERDMVCMEGSHWITEEVRKFISTKLKESNKELSEDEKKKIYE